MGRRGAGQAPARPTPRWLRPLVRRVLFRAGWIPRGVGTLDDLVPPGEVEFGAALGRLRRVVEELANADGEPPEHPYFGRMSRTEWERFHVIHAEHHLRSLR